MNQLSKFKLLISLAEIDGEVGEKERNYIFNIGRANGLAEIVLEPLFTQAHPLIVPEGLTNEQKFEYIFSLVQLMKIDERLYKDEIRFCSKVAAKLGYDEMVMFDLMLHVRSAMGPNETDSLRKLTEKYLSK